DVSLEQDLAVVGDADGVTANGAAHGADDVIRLEVHGDGGGGFGQPVPLVDVHADAANEVDELRVDCRAARDGVLQIPTHGLANLGVDQLVEDGVAGRQGKVRALWGVQRLGVLHGDLLGALEELLADLGSIGGLSTHARVDLLEDAWHAQN